MNPQAIIDAGPSLNFLSINKERLLISVTGPLKAPEAVDYEVMDKAKRDRRFAASAGTWSRLRGTKFLDILNDDPKDEALSRAVTRVSGHLLRLRSRQAKDLGEHMVIAHASVLAERGIDTTVLIDDGPGRLLAATEARRLRHQAAAQGGTGALYLMSTPDVLRHAIRTEYIPDKSEMRKTYERMRGLDDGLPPIETTDLLSNDHWKRNT